MSDVYVSKTGTGTATGTTLSRWQPYNALPPLPRPLPSRLVLPPFLISAPRPILYHHRPGGSPTMLCHLCFDLFHLVSFSLHFLSQHPGHFCIIIVPSTGHPIMRNPLSSLPPSPNPVFPDQAAKSLCKIWCPQDIPITQHPVAIAHSLPVSKEKEGAQERKRDEDVEMAPGGRRRVTEYDAIVYTRRTHRPEYEHEEPDPSPTIAQSYPLLHCHPHHRAQRVPHILAFPFTVLPFAPFFLFPFSFFPAFLPSPSADDAPLLPVKRPQPRAEVVFRGGHRPRGEVAHRRRELLPPHLRPARKEYLFPNLRSIRLEPHDDAELSFIPLFAGPQLTDITLSVDMSASGILLLPTLDLRYQQLTTLFNAYDSRRTFSEQALFVSKASARQSLELSGKRTTSIADDRVVISCRRIHYDIEKIEPGKRTLLATMTPPL
ncbi:hypothetical protein B0H14DRAFT_3436198 [Mycena olivaceomarginata]|nr:hypothetical protein B0H14DRAFT_3436198 [Mycena olivaceomarginata]